MSDRYLLYTSMLQRFQVRWWLISRRMKLYIYRSEAVRSIKSTRLLYCTCHLRQFYCCIFYTRHHYLSNPLTPSSLFSITACIPSNFLCIVRSVQKVGHHRTTHLFPVHPHAGHLVGSTWHGFRDWIS